MSEHNVTLISRLQTHNLPIKHMRPSYACIAKILCLAKTILSSQCFKTCPIFQFIGKVTSLNIFEKLFGKDEASRMARALLENISADDINEYTHMAVAAFDKFGEMNNMPK